MSQLIILNAANVTKHLYQIGGLKSTNKCIPTKILQNAIISIIKNIALMRSLTACLNIRSQENAIMEISVQKSYARFNIKKIKFWPGAFLLSSVSHSIYNNPYIQHILGQVIQLVHRGHVDPDCSCKLKSWSVKCFDKLEP